MMSAALLAVVVFVGFAALWPRLPDPAVANREGLLRWLVTRDLGREPIEVQQVLARRLEEEFQEGLDWESTATRLSEPQRQRLWDNILVLLEPWFMEKVDRYFTMAAQERLAFLDRLIDMFTAWRGLDTLRPGVTGAAKPPKAEGGLLGALLGQVDQWQTSAEPQQGKRIGEFLLALQMRWLWRQLPAGPTYWK
jgi:hypothetical protein